MEYLPIGMYGIDSAGFFVDDTLLLRVIRCVVHGKFFLYKQKAGHRGFPVTGESSKQLFKKGTHILYENARLLG